MPFEIPPGSGCLKSGVVSVILIVADEMLPGGGFPGGPVLAQGDQALLVMDDWRGRNAAQPAQLPVIGINGVLLLAKRPGQVSQLKPLLLDWHQQLLFESAPDGQRIPVGGRRTLVVSSCRARTTNMSLTGMGAKPTSKHDTLQELRPRREWVSPTSAGSLRGRSSYRIPSVVSR